MLLVRLVQAVQKFEETVERIKAEGGSILTGGKRVGGDKVRD